MRSFCITVGRMRLPFLRLLLRSRQDNVVELVDEQRHARMCVCVCVQKKKKRRKIMLIVSRSERRGKRRERRRKINFGLMELETEKGISELASPGLELTAATRTRIFIASCVQREIFSNKQIKRRSDCWQQQQQDRCVLSGDCSLD